jgi:DNA adenine methylase
MLKSTPHTAASVAVKPLAPWMGGKRLLAGRVTELIEATPHTLYAEPFVGMGGIFFRRNTAAKGEVINDASQDVITLFRILQRHFTPFVDMLRWQLTSRSEFERLAALPASSLTDLERAARFLYLQRTTFGGKVVKQSFGVVYDAPARFDVTKLMPMLEDVHERLAGVVIECLNYAEFITRYDRPGTLFYLDPPYWGNETDYGDGVFGRDDFQMMAKVLKGLKGRFILSLNDRPEVRECFKAFQIKRVETVYTAGGGNNAKKVGEVLITGR